MSRWLDSWFDDIVRPQMSGKKRTIKLIFSLGVSGVLLAVVIGIADWALVWQELTRADPLPVMWVTAILFLHYWIRSYRWHFLLPQNQRVSTRILFDATMLGSFATFILPLRAGEFVRPLFLAQHSAYSFSSAFVSIVIERFFDLCAVLIIFGVASQFVPSLPPWTQQGAMALSALASGIFLFIVVSALFPGVMRGLIEWAFGWAPPWVKRFLSDLIDGAQVVKSVKNLLMVTILTACLWASCIWAFYEFLRVVGIEPQFWLSVVTMALIALAVAAPSAPGFLGVYQIACIAAFALFGFSTEIATAYSILNHAHQFVIFIVYGLFVLVSYGISFGELRRSADEEENTTIPPEATPSESGKPFA